MGVSLTLASGYYYFIQDNLSHGKKIGTQIDKCKKLQEEVRSEMNKIKLFEERLTNIGEEFVRKEDLDRLKSKLEVRTDEQHTAILKLRSDLWNLEQTIYHILKNEDSQDIK